MNFLNNREEKILPNTKTYIWRNTSSIVVVIPVQSTYSIQLLNTKNLNNQKLMSETMRKLGWREIEREKTYRAEIMCNIVIGNSVLLMYDLLSGLIKFKLEA